jgi:hypothetical protein
MVKFSYDAARAIDRYLRVRGRHTHAHSRRVWLGVNNRPPMTSNGIYQMIGAVAPTAASSSTATNSDTTSRTRSSTRAAPRVTSWS